MQNFIIIEDLSYSLKQGAHYAREEGQMQKKLEKLLYKRLKAQTADLREIIVVGMAIGEKIPYTHATAILRTERMQTSSSVTTKQRLRAIGRPNHQG